MKNLFTLAIAALAIAACSETRKPDTYIIRGTVTGAADGDTVSLIEGRQAEMEILQNAVIKDGKFEFKGTQDSIKLLYLSYVNNDDHDRTAMASLFLENADITVTMNPDSAVSDVSGTAANELWTAFARQNAAWTDKGMKAYFESIDTTATEEARKAAAEKLEVIEDSITQFYEAFINENLTKSIVGQHILASYAESLEDEDFVHPGTAEPAPPQSHSGRDSRRAAIQRHHGRDSCRRHPRRKQPHSTLQSADDRFLGKLVRSLPFRDSKRQGCIREVPLTRFRDSWSEPRQRPRPVDHGHRGVGHDMATNL